MVMLAFSSKQHLTDCGLSVVLEMLYSISDILRWKRVCKIQKTNKCSNIRIISNVDLIKDLHGNISAKYWIEKPQKTQTSGFRSIQDIHVVFSLDYLKYLLCRDLSLQKAAIKSPIPYKTDAKTLFCFSTSLFFPALTAHSLMGNEPDQVGSALPRAAQQFDEQLHFPCDSCSTTVGINVRNHLPSPYKEWERWHQWVRPLPFLCWSSVDEHLSLCPVGAASNWWISGEGEPAV